jgi:hypothetical protein
MHNAVDRIARYQLDPSRVAGTSTVEWRSPQSGRIVAVTGVAPRGRKGLWDAMARATAAPTPAVTVYPTEAALAVEPEVEEEIPPPLALADERAHLGYLSRLAEAADTTVQVAPVVSLADYRLSRRR